MHNMTCINSSCSNGSEKTATYWEESVRELKRDFGNKHVVISSVMAAYFKEDWQELTRRAIVCIHDPCYVY